VRSIEEGDSKRGRGRGMTNEEGRGRGRRIIEGDVERKEKGCSYFFSFLRATIFSDHIPFQTSPEAPEEINLTSSNSLGLISHWLVYSIELVFLLI
jgi:hypothetical protein